MVGRKLVIDRVFDNIKGDLITETSLRNKQLLVNMTHIEGRVLCASIG